MGEADAVKMEGEIHAAEQKDCTVASQDEKRRVEIGEAVVGADPTCEKSEYNCKESLVRRRLSRRTVRTNADELVRIAWTAASQATEQACCRDAAAGNTMWGLGFVVVDSNMSIAVQGSSCYWRSSEETAVVGYLLDSLRLAVAGGWKPEPPASLSNGHL